jgi:hypothetical protein
MNTDLETAIHNEKFRRMTTDKKIGQIVFNIYKKKLQEPSPARYKEIVLVNFIPEFNNEKDKKLYGMYLPDI